MRVVPDRCQPTLAWPVRHKVSACDQSRSVGAVSTLSVTDGLVEEPSPDDDGGGTGIAPPLADPERPKGGSFTFSLGGRSVSKP
jgi:hypothetical protein